MTNKVSRIVGKIVIAVLLAVTVTMVQSWVMEHSSLSRVHTQVTPYRRP